MEAVADDDAPCGPHDRVDGDGEEDAGAEKVIPAPVGARRIAAGDAVRRPEVPTT